MSLSRQLMMQFFSELLSLPKPYHRNIYQIKQINSQLGDAMFFSCRFKTQTLGTFLLSIDISLRTSNPHVRISVHQLCDRRIFTQTVYYTDFPLQRKDSIAGIFEIPQYNHYYQTNRSLPFKIMAGVFKHYGRQGLIAFIDQLEEEDQNGTTK